MDIAPADDGRTTIELEERELKLLVTALERSLFLDIPPHMQGATMEFAERLLRALGQGELSQD